MPAQKLLTLVRHAKSSWGDALLSDRERPLNNRGLRDAPEMGKRLAARRQRPDLIVSSPAERAITTARLIADEINYPPAKIVLVEELYLAGREGLLDVIRQLDDRYQSVMVVGHNPDMTELFNSLADARIDDIPTCGMALFGFNVASWDAVVAGSGECILYDFPKNAA